MTPIICAKTSPPKRRSPSSPTTHHAHSNIRSTNISMPSAIWWNAVSPNSSSSAASPPASKKPPETIEPSSLSPPSSCGCDKCPHDLKQFPPDLNLRDSQTVSDDGDSCIDSLCRRGLAVPKAYSCDLRERVIEAVAAGASRREAAERFEVSAASAVKWVQRWRDDNSAAAKPRGGSVSPLEEFTTEILAVIAEHPDLTLVETLAELRKRRIRTSRSALWRFLDRHNITLKTHLGQRPPVGVETADVYPRDGRERPRAFWCELARKKTWSMGCCARESGDAARRSRLGN